MKGISFVEHHVEKIVVGAAAAILVVAVATEVLSSRAVKVGNQTLSPSNVGETLDAQARAIESRLTDGRVPSEFAPERIPQVAGEFTERLAASVSASPTLPRIEPTLAGVLLDSESLSDTWYRMPTVPTLSIVSEVMQTSDAIVEETFELPDFKGLAALFPNRASAVAFDITWTTPAAWIDLAALRAELRKADAVARPPLAAAPSAWYQEGTFIVDVVFEREERRLDGTWGNRQVVQPLPDRLSFRSRIPRADIDLRNEVLATLSRPVKQFEILQPEFYPTKNDAFISPEHAGTTTPGVEIEPRDILRLRRRIADKDREIARRDERLKEIGGPLEDDATRGRDSGGSQGSGGSDGGRGAGGGGRGPGGGGGGGGRGPGGGGGLGGGPAGGTGAGGGGASGDAQKDAERRRLTRLLKSLREDRERLQADLESKVPSAKPDDAEAVVRTIADLASMERVMVWCHDVKVSPEVSYRYRAVAQVFNPFFERKRQLVSQQSSYSDPLVLVSAPTAWSEPVQVTPSSTFFVTGGSLDGGALGLGTVEVEVYRLVEGVRRRQEFTVQPGDRIGRLVEPRRSEGGDAVDYTTDWFVVAIVEDTAVERAEHDRSKGYVVVVRQLEVGDGVNLRSPDSDSGSSDRRRLMEEAVLAQPTVTAPPSGTEGTGS